MVETSPKQVDIAIIGGGMVGLSLLQLINQFLPQVRACLIEAHAFNHLAVNQGAISQSSSAQVFSQASFDGRSTALARGSMEIFEALGLWGALRTRATPISQVHVSDRGHLGRAHYGDAKTVAKHKPRTSDGAELGYVVENTWLGQHLLQAFLPYVADTLDHADKVLDQSSISIVAPASVMKIQPQRGHVSLHIEQKTKKEKKTPPLDEAMVERSASVDSHQNKSNRKQELTLKANLVIIADGARSPSRKKLGIAAEHHNYHQAAVIANVEFSEAHRGIAYERFTARGPMALLPLGGSAQARRSALVWTHPIAELDQVMAWSDDKFLQQLQKAFGYRLGAFLRVGQRASYPLELVQAKEQVRSNIVLMGNAAHYLHPVAGQGFNLALRDCAQLVSTLQLARQQGRTYGELGVLQDYLAKQEQDQWLTTQLSHNFNRLFSNNHKPWQLLRNLGLIGLEFCPPLKHHFFAQMMGRGQKQIQFHDE